MGGGLHEPAAHFVHLGDLQFTGGLVDPGKAVGKSLAVRKGGQHGIAEKPNHHDRFLSTPSVRRATCPCCGKPIKSHISIHALREEGDDLEERKAFVYELFLSTPSVRRATLHAVDKLRLLVISIHALREEGDAYITITTADIALISIHALREEGDWNTLRTTFPIWNFSPRPP